MIRRLLRARLRLIDAVALAALAVLGLKLAALTTAPRLEPGGGVPGGGAAGVVKGEDQLPAFARALANARTNYVAPDVTMTGATKPKAVPSDPPAPAKGDAATPAPAPASAGPSPIASAPVAPPTSSPAERALLERLGERRDELQQRDRDIELRERLLENAEKKLEARINELKALEAKAEAASQAAAPEAAALKNVVTMYETMKPKEAARVFDRLAHDVLVPVVLQMNPKKMAEVLAVMSPEAAEKLTVALAGRARLASGPPPAPAQPAASPLLPSTELPAIEPTPRPPR